MKKRRVVKLWRSYYRWHSASLCRTIFAPSGAPTSHWEEFMKWTFAHEKRDDKGELINMRTVTIELRFDADEEEKHEVLKVAAMQAAKHLFTSALLISSKRKPQIAMYTSDMFAGQQEIELAESLTELLPE